MLAHPAGAGVLVLIPRGFAEEDSHAAEAGEAGDDEGHGHERDEVGEAVMDGAGEQQEEEEHDADADAHLAVEREDSLRAALDGHAGGGARIGAAGDDADVRDACGDDLLRGLRGASAALNTGWLKIAVPATPPSPILQLGAGEAESIALALTEPGTLLLMDEAEGRAAARSRGIVLTGAVGVLISARRKGWIPALKPELLALRSQARFFLGAKFFSDALGAVGETV